MPVPEIGQPAPPFTLPDADGVAHSLADHIGAPGIVYFYPAASTPGCTLQAVGFRDELPRLTAAGYWVLGISPDTPAKLAAFRDAEQLTFPLLSDPDHAVLEAYGAWGERMLYGKKVVGVIRSTAIIAADGTIELLMRNVKATGHVERLLRELGIA
jgi:thioredoxin-dependent peroxiredoxin